MDKWINVKDRLPDKEGKYLCCVSMPYGGYLDIVKFSFNLEDVDEFNFYKEKRCGWYKYDSEWGYYECGGVTHWMPLPESPEE